MIRIVLLGTSITRAGGDPGGWHEGTPAKPGLGPRLRSWLPGQTIEIVNHGHGGAASDYLLARVPDVIAANPSIVMIDSCTNDSHGAKRITPSAAMQNVADIIAQLRAALPGVFVGIWTLAPVLHQIAPKTLIWTDRYHDGYRRLASGQHTIAPAPVIDYFFDALPCWSRLCDDGRDRRPAHIPDGVHPTQAAMLSYVVPYMANAMGARLQPIINQVRAV